MVKERIKWTKQQIDSCRRDEQLIADFIAAAFAEEMNVVSFFLVLSKFFFKFFRFFFRIARN